MRTPLSAAGWRSYYSYLVMLFCSLLWLFGLKQGSFQTQDTVLKFQVFLLSHTETERLMIMSGDLSVSKSTKTPVVGSLFFKTCFVVGPTHLFDHFPDWNHGFIVQ